MTTSIQERAGLDASELAVVLELIEAVTDADGVSPVSEHVLLHLRHGGEREAVNLLAHAEDGGLVGYAHLDPTDVVGGGAAELAVHPAHRGAGVGADLVARLESLTGDHRLRLWAHGRLPGAQTLAERLGYREARVLFQLRRSLLSGLPTVELPEGITLRSFVVDQDEAAWTEVNNRAFADHPDQGGWTLHQIRTREKEPWFDPAGFLLAVRPDDSIAGFHWTKIHGAREHGDHAHKEIGEVYAVGIDPSMQGKGLGKSLTVAGLRYLRGRGLDQVMLYVDESNVGAVTLYERLGFTTWGVDVSYRRPS